MPSRYAAGKRDDNEPQIRAVLDAYRVRYVYGHEGDGYDLMVMIGPMIELWEVKNPAQPPAKRHLTECEKDCMAYCQKYGITYRIIETVEQANRAIAESRY